MEQKENLFAPVARKIQMMFATGLELMPLLPVLRILGDSKALQDPSSFLKKATAELGITNEEFLRKVLDSNNQAFEKLFIFLEAVEATHKLIHESNIKLPEVGEMMFRQIINEKSNGNS